MKFVIESAGGVASRTAIGGHVLLFDQADPLYGGTDRGPSPLDVMLASVGACAHYYAAAYLRGRQLPVDDLQVSISGQKESAPTPHVENVLLEIELPRGLRPDQKRAIERAVERCPALGTLNRGAEIELVLRSPDASEMEEAGA